MPCREGFENCPALWIEPGDLCSDAACDIVFAFVFLHTVFDGVGGFIIALTDFAGDEFHQHDRQADDRHDGQERPQQQVQRRVALGHAGGVSQ